MIDMHNHILPAIDDGPQSIDGTLKLLRQAKQQGVTGIIATPHHLSLKYNNPIVTVIESINNVMQIPEVISICLPIYPGQEIRISDKILTDIKNNQIIGLNYSKYLLIEFPSNEIPHYSQQLFFELQLQQFIPIIAHPERNNVFLKQSDTLYYLIKNGALSQLTIASVLGKLGKKIQKFALQLIDHNLTHFIASDAHHYCYRPFENNQLYQNTKLKHYASEITQMLKNSQCIIKDESILKKQPLKIDKRFLKLF